MSIVREPAVAGMFYPGDSKELKKTVKTYLDDADTASIDGDIFGIISPHAGYVYSGQVAAHGFKAVQRMNYDTVIIIAPSHRVYFDGVALWDRGGFKTPLGVIDIDEDMARNLLDIGGVVKPGKEPHLGEHSLEVQLPFLQSALEGFKIVPLVMGTQTADVCKKLAQSIYRVVRESGRKNLLVGSTDLSHYYPYSEAVELDKVIVDDLNAFDVEALAEDIDRGKAEACGAGPMITTMMICEKMGADKAKVLKYANSGDVSGDKSGVVGYVSAVFYKGASAGGNAL